MQQGTCRGPSTQFKAFQPSLRSFTNTITSHCRNSHRTITVARSGREKVDSVSSSPSTTPTKVAAAADILKVSRRAFQGEALLLALLGTIIQSEEAQAIGFKKDLKKKKIPIEQYSTLGKTRNL
jgi:hypothetical protein